MRTKGVRVNERRRQASSTPLATAQENPDADFSRWTTGEQLARVIEWLCGRRLGPALGRHDPRLWPRRERATTLLIDNLAQLATPAGRAGAAAGRRPAAACR